MIFTTEKDIEINVDHDRHVVIRMKEGVRLGAQKHADERHFDKAPGFRDYLRREDDERAEDRRGVPGEFAFGQWTHLKPNTSIIKSGDGGPDFTLRVTKETLNVTVAQLPFNLFLRADRDNPRYKPADLHLIGSVSKDKTCVIFLGYETREFLGTCPTKVFDSVLQYDNHYVPTDETRSIWDLWEKNGGTGPLPVKGLTRPCRCLREALNLSAVNLEYLHSLRSCGKCDTEPGSPGGQLFMRASPDSQKLPAVRM